MHATAASRIASSGMGSTVFLMSPTRLWCTATRMNPTPLAVACCVQVQTVIASKPRKELNLPSVISLCGFWSPLSRSTHHVGGRPSWGDFWRAGRHADATFCSASYSTSIRGHISARSCSRRRFLRTRPLRRPFRPRLRRCLDSIAW